MYFRLTSNMEAPLGAFKSYALFRYYMIIILKAFAKNTNNILGSLDSFIHDPLIDQSSDQ